MARTMILVALVAILAAPATAQMTNWFGISSARPASCLADFGTPQNILGCPTTGGCGCTKDMGWGGSFQTMCRRLNHVPCEATLNDNGEGSAVCGGSTFCVKGGKGGVVNIYRAGDDGALCARPGGAPAAGMISHIQVQGRTRSPGSYTSPPTLRSCVYPVTQANNSYGGPMLDRTTYDSCGVTRFCFGCQCNDFRPSTPVPTVLTLCSDRVVATMPDAITSCDVRVPQSVDRGTCKVSMIKGDMNGAGSQAFWYNNQIAYYRCGTYNASFTTCGVTKTYSVEVTSGIKQNPGSDPSNVCPGSNYNLPTYTSSSCTLTSFTTITANNPANKDAIVVVNGKTAKFTKCGTYTITTVVSSFWDTSVVNPSTPRENIVKVLPKPRDNGCAQTFTTTVTVSDPAAQAAVTPAGPTATVGQVVNLPAVSSCTTLGNTVVEYKSSGVGATYRAATPDEFGLDGLKLTVKKCGVYRVTQPRGPCGAPVVSEITVSDSVTANTDASPVPGPDASLPASFTLNTFTVNGQTGQRYTSLVVKLNGKDVTADTSVVEVDKINNKVTVKVCGKYDITVTYQNCAKAESTYSFTIDDTLSLKTPDSTVNVTPNPAGNNRDRIPLVIKDGKPTATVTVNQYVVNGADKDPLSVVVTPSANTKVTGRVVEIYTCGEFDITTTYTTNCGKTLTTVYKVSVPVDDIKTTGAAPKPDPQPLTQGGVTITLPQYTGVGGDSAPRNPETVTVFNVATNTTETLTNTNQVVIKKCGRYIITTKIQGSCVPKTDTYPVEITDEVTAGAATVNGNIVTYSTGSSSSVPIIAPTDITVAKPDGGDAVITDNKVELKGCGTFNITVQYKNDCDSKTVTTEVTINPDNVQVNDDADVPDTIAVNGVVTVPTFKVNDAVVTGDITVTGAEGADWERVQDAPRKIRFKKCGVYNITVTKNAKCAGQQYKKRITVTDDINELTPMDLDVCPNTDRTLPTYNYPIETVTITPPEGALVSVDKKNIKFTSCNGGQKYKVSVTVKGACDSKTFDYDVLVNDDDVKFGEIACDKGYPWTTKCTSGMAAATVKAVDGSLCQVVRSASAANACGVSKSLSHVFTLCDQCKAP